MQTFLPYPNFSKSAACLDRQRLGKQRVEVLQLLKAITTNTGWSNHPAARMWSGHASALTVYGVAICVEWRHRGYKDSCLEKILAYRNTRLTLPPWLGDPTFHAAHRSNLLRKDRKWYCQFGWAETDDLPYVWPNATYN